MLAAYLFVPFQNNLAFNKTVNQLGLIIAILGFFMGLIAVIQLNKNLTPFPTPKASSELINAGLYKYIRHPIYTGIILASVGFGVYRDSLCKLIIGIILWGLFYYKSKYEEKLMIVRYHDYEGYIKKTGRFFPVVFVKK